MHRSWRIQRSVAVDERSEDIAPLRAAVLRGLYGVDGLALAYGTRLLMASPIHDIDDGYAVLLSVEMARHPRLGAILDETEQGLRARKDGLSWRRKGCLQLIRRIRSRSSAFFVVIAANR